LKKTRNQESKKAKNELNELIFIDKDQQYAAMILQEEEDVTAQ